MSRRFQVDVTFLLWLTTVVSVGCWLLWLAWTPLAFIVCVFWEGVVFDPR